MEEYLSVFPEDLSCGFDRPLTPEEAVFGCKGISALDLSRSSGLGGPKSAWVDVVTKTLRPELAAKVAERIRQLEAGEWELPAVASALKNELRPISKVVDGATRHFNPYPFDILIVQRMFLAPMACVFCALGPTTTG